MAETLPTTTAQAVQWGWRVDQHGEAAPAESRQTAMQNAHTAATKERDAGRKPWAYVCWRSDDGVWQNDGAVSVGLPVLFTHGGMRVLAGTDGTLRVAVDDRDLESPVVVRLGRKKVRALRDALAAWLDPEPADD